jgi:hypothetical protein
MANTFSQFLVRAIPKAKDDLVDAVERLPEDKRNWSPSGSARTALDQAAECAILNGSTAQTLQTRTFDNEFMAVYEKQKADLVAQGWQAIKAKLDENTAKVVAAIGGVPESDFHQTISMPWGELSLEQIMSYPYWNTCYHEGQVTYIETLM